MYSLDVNFLKDRHLSQTGKGTPAAKISTAINLRKQTPLLIGVGVGAGLLTLTGLLGLILGWQTSETQAKIQQLDAELGQLQAQSKKLEDMKAQLTAVGEENEALVTVFNQIRPWSAILQEIRLQTPPRPLCYHLLITQRSNLAGARRSRAGRAPVVAGRPGEGVLLGGLGGDVCGGGLAAGGRPLRGGAAGVDADVPVCGLRRSTVTA